MQRGERILQPFGRAVAARRLANSADADILLIQLGAERVAIAREFRRNRDAFVREDSKSEGICEMASLGTEEFVYLYAVEVDALGAGVDRVNYQDHLVGSLAAGECLK